MNYVFKMISKNPTLLLFILLSSFVLCPANAWADEDTAKPLRQLPPQVERISSIKGENIGFAKAMIQSRDGYLYVGTGKGLLRYDGIDGVFYQKDDNDPNSIGSNNIISLVEDSKGAIWLATAFGGLNRFDPVTKRFERFMQNADDPTSMPTNNGLFVAVRDEKTLWYGHTKGLEIVDIETKARRSFNFTGSDKAAAPFKLVKDNYGMLWIGTIEDGLFRYDVKTGEFKQYLREQDNNDSIASDMITALVLDRYNVLWVGGRHGLSTADTKTGEAKKVDQYYNKDITSYRYGVSNLFIDKQERVWIGWLGGTTAYFDPELRQIKKSALTNYTVFQFYLDQQNLFWLATTGGLIKVHPDSLTYKNFSVAKDMIASGDFGYNDKVWIGGDGLFEVDIDKWTVTRKDSRLLTRFISGKDAIYSLTRLEQRLQLEQLFPNNPDKNQLLSTYPVNKDSNPFALALFDDVIWFSISSLVPNKVNGVYGYNVKTGRQYRGAKGVQVWALTRLNKDSLLLGTQNGLAKYDFIKDRLDYLSLDDLTQSWISCLYRQGDGTFWFCIRDKGIGRYFSDSQQIEIYPWEPGDIRSIIADEQGKLWLGSESGTVMFHPQTKQFKLYTPALGMPFLTYNFEKAAVIPGKGIVMGSLESLLFFNPSEISESNITRPTILSGFRLLNQEVTPDPLDENALLQTSIDKTERLVLSHEDYAFSFSFITLDYISPGKLQYAFMMEGLDEQWFYTSADNRTASYTTLPPGEYRFRVKGTNSSGQWNDGSGIDIIILPPWWASTTAYVVYVMTVLLSIVLFIQLRTRQLKLRAKELEYKIAERTQQLEERAETISALLKDKDRLFANVSHEFRTPLTLILGPLEKLLDGESEQFKRDTLLLAKANANRMLMMVDQLLDIAKSQSDSVEHTDKVVVDATAVCRFMIENYRSLAVKRQIDILLDSDTEMPVLVEMVPDALEKIFSNLLTNALKYSDDNTQVAISMKLKEKQVCIAVSDQGVGIAPEDLTLVFDRFTRLDITNRHVPGAGIGLALVKQLVELHQGSIDVVSERDKGSTFTVTLPLYQGLGESHAEVNEALVQSDLAHFSDNMLDEIQLPDGFEFDDKQPHVLVIEDNLDMQHYIASVLREHFAVSLRGDGESGIEFAREHLPDLIVSDVMMPKKDGFEVANTLKNDPLTAHIPLVLLTAHGDKESRIKGWSNLIDEFLQKPFDARELLIRLNGLLSIRQLLKQRLQRMFSHGEIEPLAESEDEPVFNNPADRRLFELIEQVLEENYSNEDFSMDDFARCLNVSRRQLSRKTKTLMDLTPAEAVRNYRLKKAAEMLKEGASVSVVAYSVGFSSHSYFSRCFKAQYGCLPSAFH